MPWMRCNNWDCYRRPRLDYWFWKSYCKTKYTSHAAPWLRLARISNQWRIKALLNQNTTHKWSIQTLRTCWTHPDLTLCLKKICAIWNPLTWRLTRKQKRSSAARLAERSIRIIIPFGRSAIGKSKDIEAHFPNYQLSGQNIFSPEIILMLWILPSKWVWSTYQRLHVHAGLEM